MAVMKHMPCDKHVEKNLANIMQKILTGKLEGGKLFNWNRGKVFNENLHPKRALTTGNEP